MKETTLVLPVRKATNEILLAMKKRGFGVGKLNGMGGKIELGESIREAAAREVKEEIGIDIDPAALIPAVDITFTFENKPDWDNHCLTFLAYEWSGDPIETEEMSPQFFQLDTIPFERMWTDDKEWLPLALAGKKLQARFHFTEDGSTILRRDLQEVNTLNF
ncbi:MAG: hydrolase [Candidatus Kaiserbacteria bacterium]|nr:hydrolase [Candidatus Kaiserbacteria bacterium]